MQHLLRLQAFILIAITFQLLGCSEDTDTDTAPTETLTAETEPIPTKPTIENTYAKLKSVFPKPIFDEGFTTLSEVTASKTYLDFLVQEYRTEKPFRTLAEYLDIAEPDPERYTPFLKKFIKKPSEQDIAIVHQMTLRYRCANALRNQINAGNNFGQALGAELEKKLSILEEAPVQAWLALLRPDQMQNFFPALENFVIETERADGLLIKEQFKAHGKDDGILWIALRHPALTAEILNNFTSTDVFLKWIDGDFFPPKQP